MKTKRYVYPPSSSKNVEPKPAKQTKDSLKSELESLRAELKRLETKQRQTERDLAQMTDQYETLNALLGDVLNDRESVISYAMLLRMRAEIRS